MDWWGKDMDLTPWTVDAATTCTDMAYAQAVAQKRARVRGVRQRVAIGDRKLLNPGSCLLLVVSDAEVCGPCS